MERNGLYGSLAGSVAAITLQPLENIKMVMLVPPKEAKMAHKFLKDVVISTKYLYNDGGLLAFYRGLVPNVLRTAFSSSIFFSSLRLFEQYSKEIENATHSKMVPFISSTLARIMSVFLSNPLSLLETRYEYGGHERWKGGILHNLNKIYKVEGVKGFWNGGLATCYKEGIFAGAYYTLYQEGKALGVNAFVAGMIAGMISTAFTHPLEIIRAEIQSFILTNN